MEDFIMEVAFILYGVFAGAVVVWCTLHRVRPHVNYVAISRVALAELMPSHDGLVVVELRRSETTGIPGALSVPFNQLQGLLRWMPPRTTLVLCGANEVELCRQEIESPLLRLDIEMVYVLEDGRGSRMAQTAPKVATRLL
jgi:hypothetical protein